MDAVIGLHTTPGLALAGIFAVLAVVSGGMALTHRPPGPWLERLRMVALAVLVAEAALGLVLVFRGTGPAEWIHWLYGVLVIAAVLLPPTLAPGGSARMRSLILAGGFLFAAIFSWRLWGSG